MDYPQSMTLEFVDRVMQGRGEDDLGPFRIEGEMGTGDPQRGDVPVGWIKTYDAAHSVLYIGQLRGDVIRGEWSIGEWCKGGFELRFVPD